MIVKVRFFANGFRKTPPFGTMYRPHFVVKGTSEYLGIQFEELEKTAFEEEIVANVKPLYISTGVDYSALVPKASFEIREGSHIVGEGTVMSS